MKRLIAIVSMVGAATLLHGQGYIIFNGSSAGVETNTASFYSQVAYGTGTAGKTGVPSTGLRYDYALLYSAIDPGAGANPTNAAWSVATTFGGGTLMGTNAGPVTGVMTGNGAAGGVQVNLASGSLYYVELVAWSANLGTLSQVLTQYGTDSWTANGYFNYEAYSSLTPFATAGTGDPVLIGGVWANNAFSLYAVAPAGVPEPSTMALAGLGGAALLLFRRRKH